MQSFSLLIITFSYLIIENKSFYMENKKSKIESIKIKQRRRKNECTINCILFGYFGSLSTIEIIRIIKRRM